MLTYNPLDESKREIRVLRIPKPRTPLTSDSLLQCALLRVSLDDVHDQYVRFLDATKEVGQEARDILWLSLKYPSIREELRWDEVQDGHPHLALGDAVRLVRENASFAGMASDASSRYKWVRFLCSFLRMG